VKESRRRSKLTHLLAYGCRAYAMTENAQEKKKRKWKLNPRVYIDYLVEYNFTNIFRIWISFKDKMISIRDVLFNEQIFFNEKPDNLTPQMFDEMDSLITKIQLPETQAINEKILEDDEIEKSPTDSEIENFDEKKDLELATALEEALNLSIPSINKTAFHTALSIINKNNDREQTFCQTCSQRMKNDRFDNFDEKKISSTFHEAFAAARQFKKPMRIHKQNLPTLPKTI